MLLSALVAGLAVGQSAQAKSRRHDDRAQSAPTGEPQNPAKPVADRRDPADIALDKKIKSICRGC
jgi:hypothetical protein